MELRIGSRWVPAKKKTLRCFSHHFPDLWHTNTHITALCLSVSSLTSSLDDLWPSWVTAADLGGASITMHSCWESCNAVVLNRIWFLLFSCFITSDKSSQSAKAPWMSSVLLLCHAPPFMLFTLNIKTIHLLHRLLLFQRNTKAFTAQRFLGLTRDLLPNGHARFVWEVSWSDARSSEQLLSMEDSNSLFWARAAWLISSPCRSAKLVSAACNHNLSPVVSTHSLCADVLYSYLFITEEL